MIPVDQKEIKIRSAKMSDYDIINRLCDLRFGKGYLSVGEFSNWLKNPDLFLVLEYKGDFVGYVCFVPATPEQIASYMKLPLESVLEVSSDPYVIHCRSTALFESYEHMGFMKRLWDVILENTKKHGYKAAFGPAWEYNNFVPMDRLLSGLGFEKIAKKENLWYDDENYTCIICNGRCSCSAVIYKLIL